MREVFKRIYDKVHAQRCVMQLLIIALAVTADQVSKYLVDSALEPKQSITVIQGVFNLTYIMNEGASFGILQGKTVFFIIATAITLIVLSIYMVKARKKQLRWLRVCLSLIFAGATGNFIDRVTNHGLVRDFLDFSQPHIGALRFPWIFNVADMCLVVGSIMLGIYLLFIHKEKDGKPLFARRDKNKDEMSEESGDTDGGDEGGGNAAGGKEKKPEGAD